MILTLCLTLAFLPGVIDEDGSCVSVRRVSDRTLIELAERPGLPTLWAHAVEDTMNRRSDDGLGD
jgi:hypothetical protein